MVATVKVGGTYRDVLQASVKVGGTYRRATGYIKQNGTYRVFTQLDVTPVIAAAQQDFGGQLLEPSISLHLEDRDGNRVNFDGFSARFTSSWDNYLPGNRTARATGIELYGGNAHRYRLTSTTASVAGRIRGTQFAMRAGQGTFTQSGVNVTRTGYSTLTGSAFGSINPVTYLSSRLIFLARSPQVVVPRPPEAGGDITVPARSSLIFANPQPTRTPARVWVEGATDNWTEFALSVSAPASEIETTLGRFQAITYNTNPHLPSFVNNRQYRVVIT